MAPTSASSTAAAADAWFECLRTGTLAQVEAMLQEDAMLLTLSKETPTPYTEAIRRNANIILGNNTTRMNSLHLAISFLRESDVIMCLLDEEDSPYFINARWGDDNTALHLASLLGMTSVVYELVKLGADVNAKNRQGLTPIDMAHEDDMKSVLMGCELPSPAGGASSVDDEVTTVSLKPSTPPPTKKTDVKDAPGSSLAIALAETMKSSPVFCRESFGIGEITAHAEAISHNPKLLDQSPTKTTQGSQQDVDYFKRMSVFNAKPTVITPEQAINEFAVKLNSSKYRTSVDMLAAKCLQASTVTGQKREHRNMLFIRVIELSDFQGKMVPANGKLYFSVALSMGDQRQFSMSFGKGTNVPINDTFKFIVPDDTVLARVSLMSKYVQPAGIKGMFRKQFGGLNSSSPVNTSMDKDVEIASFTIPRLSELAQNIQIDNAYVLCASTPEPVRGMAAVQFYYHTDRMAVWTPQSFEDCTRLQKEREYENQYRVFWEGELQHSDSMQSWKQRMAKVRNGKVYMYDVETQEPKEEIDLDGYKSATIMTIEECDIRNSFKITFGGGTSYHYFFVQTAAQMQAATTAINRMMASIIEKQRGIENTPPIGSLRMRTRMRPAGFSSTSIRGTPTIV